MADYSVGIDFGSLSARAVVADTSSGRVVGSASREYAHGVLDRFLPDGTPLRRDCALQCPGDYAEALFDVLAEAVKNSGVQSQEIKGIGLDATACTVLPLDAEWTPMACREKYRCEPEAYIKMWKHHGAAEQSCRLTEVFRAKVPELLDSFGGSVSAESLFPRMLEMNEYAPVLLEETYEYAEVADWLVFLLTGARCRNLCAAGYKAYYTPGRGYPPEELFREAGYRGSFALKDKLPSPVLPNSSVAGFLTEEAARRTGLCAGTPVAAGNVDAHAGVPAAGIADAGHMLAIIGTSACVMLLGDEYRGVPGICGTVKDGILPGFFGYEAGQTSVGDMYGHFVSGFVPEEYSRAAKELGMGLHEYLSSLAKDKKPGETGLLALDWLNGNRSTLCDYNLSGLVLGMNMQTRCEDIYRALLESTAFGCRVIAENFIEHGLEVKDLTATGGISRKNPLAMQIYADVLGMPVQVADTAEGPAFGSAMYGALAAGSANGGYDSMKDAVNAMKPGYSAVYYPDAEHHRIYSSLYDEYKRLYYYFGRENPVMKKLKAKQ